MALAFLTFSVVLQACAVAQAVVLARRRNRSGWVFFVGALVLMFSRRAFTLYGALQLQHPGDPVAELLALLISALLVMGLYSLSQHGAEPVAQLASEAPAAKVVVERLERPAFVLAILALAGTSSLIYFAYAASRQAITEQLNRGNLGLARQLSANAAAAQAEARDPVREIASVWAQRQHEPNVEYVTVMGEDGRLLLHSREPAQVGSLVGTASLTGAASGAQTLLELARSHQDWVGRSEDASGETELVAHVYDPALAALVSVHVPAAGVDAKIRLAAMPWGLGFAATLMIVFPLSLGLLYRASSASQAAAARAAEQQRQLEDRYRKIVETTNDGVWLVDAQARTLFVNQRLATLLRHSVEGMLGRPIYDFLDEDAKQQAAARLARRRQGIAEVYELRFRRHDGSELWTSLSASPVTDDSGNYLGALAMVTDVTERRALEEKLRQTQKMEAIGLLAGGVAHDFNNLLTVIQGNAALLREAGSGTEEELDAIEHAAGRAAELTRQLLTFGRKQAMHRRSLDLGQSVAHVLQMLDRILGEDIEVLTDLALDLPAIHADAGMLEQVIVNLAVNARDAMPTGGQLRISSVSRTLDASAAAAIAEGRPGRYVCLSVSDTGTGIEARHLAQIFEPFFTTKDIGKGTGLGLATVYAIARQHEGWVTVDTELGVGSTFRVWFPAAPAAAAQDDPLSSGPSADVSLHRELILVVEDDANVRPLVERVLRGVGYRVLLAESSVEALEIWAQHRDQIQLLLTDLVMPGGMTGQQLAERLWHERPELEVLFTSGYSAELPSRNGSSGALVHFLAKPYLPKDLARAVRQRLLGRAERARTPAA